MRTFKQFFAALVLAAHLSSLVSASPIHVGGRHGHRSVLDARRRVGTHQGLSGDAAAGSDGPILGSIRQSDSAVQAHHLDQDSGTRGGFKNSQNREHLGRSADYPDVPNESAGSQQGGWAGGDNSTAYTGGGPFAGGECGYPC